MAEAEYVVATYMYMRFLGYPAEKITILTTYNGQKALIKDIITAKCAKTPFIGEPHKVVWMDYYYKSINAFVNNFFNPPQVSTVDKYQGQQNVSTLVKSEYRK